MENVSSRTTSAVDAEQIEDLAEVDGYLRTLEDLTGLLLEDGSLEHLLAEVLDLFTAAIEGCDAASITVRAGRGYATAASTGHRADAVDSLQYELREGPCIDALESGREHHVPDLTEAWDWPEALRESALAHGFNALLALPLEVDGTRVGALNLFSAGTQGFRPQDHELAWRLAAPAAVTVANGQAYRRVVVLSEQLRTALDSRAVIDQAKGVIIARSGCSPAEAFELLKELSQARNRKLRDVATAIVASRGQLDRTS
jgi:transcriptional regulator with GAF, ATPase, and Fis domain